jgi:hypothetical protein
VVTKINYAVCDYSGALLGQNRNRHGISAVLGVERTHISGTCILYIYSNLLTIVEKAVQHMLRYLGFSYKNS